MLAWANDASKNSEAYLIFQGRKELLIAWKDVRPILDKHAQSPQTERGFTIILDNIQMRVVNTSAHLANLLDDGIDSF